MTPPDKLPQEIADKIKSDATAYTDLPRFIAYTNGAIAWARWKVKHDELQVQAQRMADALEWIKTYGPADDLTVKFVNKALREFKDGKGKEAICSCSLQQLAAHGECYKCPGQHTRHEITNPTK